MGSAPWTGLLWDYGKIYAWTIQWSIFGGITLVPVTTKIHNVK